MRAFKAIIAASTSATLALALPTTVLAQTEGQPAGTSDNTITDRDIIVTATRQDQLHSKAPISVTAFTQESMDRQGVRDFDLERIEVLRGPQGTLFGAGAQGGVVRFITPRPDLDDMSIYSRAELSTTEGGDASYEAGLAVGVPLVEGQVGLRVSGYYRHDGGWVDRDPFNVAPPSTTELYENENSANTLAFRGTLSFQLSDAINVTPAIYYHQVETNGTSTLWELLSDADEGRFVNGYSVGQGAKDSFLLPSLNITADLGSAVISPVTSYFDRDGESVQDYTNLNTNFIFDTPFPFVPGWQAQGVVTARQKMFSQELRLSSGDSDSPIRWTVGGYYSRARQIESFKIEDAFTADLIPLPLIFGIGLTDGRYIFTSANDTTDKQWAVFAQVDAELADGLTATVGARYSDTTFDFRRDLGGPLNYTGSGPETTTTTTTGVQSAKPFTPKFGLSYEIDGGNMVDASVFVIDLFNTAPLLGKSPDTDTSSLYYYRTVRAADERPDSELPFPTWVGRGYLAARALPMQT